MTKLHISVYVCVYVCVLEGGAEFVNGQYVKKKLANLFMKRKK